ncbi:TetR/AcrR family transcriptional regulator [Massilia sp. S19_KUP03_FR1]|uniref:TetR/AcrR family transcriptional regulator n=1 Tax=Massilia sp. S19_KUP03_FR1 TaxID=3025503 RepID=UPI002FCDC56C
MAKAYPSETSDVRANILAAGQRIMSGKGFSAVGLNEILAAASVPKGSFYHYFGSKDAFGVALLDSYFAAYLAEMDEVLGQSGVAVAQRLMQYFDSWQANQSFADCQGKCLAVKLAAEVADLSEAMRLAIDHGTAGIVTRLTAALEAGVRDGSLAIDGNAAQLAATLYQQWLGASVMVKIMRSTAPFDAALAVTRRLLHLQH